MADDAEPYGQVKTILLACLALPQLANGSGPFTRTLIVTTEIADLKVSEKQVLVHPEWAVEQGPIEAATRIISVVHEFERRKVEARTAMETEIRSQLQRAVEWARRSGMEYLIEEIHESPVMRGRALLRREGAARVMVERRPE